MSRAFQPAIILPTFNVEDTVAATIDEIIPWLDRHNGELLIIDNASLDQTTDEILRVTSKLPVASAQRVHLEFRQRNLGYGASIKRGLNFFKESNVSHVAILHSDRQTNNADLLQSFYETFVASGAAHIVASRFTQESDISRYSRLRVVGNVFFNKLTTLVSGVTVTDPGSAMVMIQREILNEIEIDTLPSDWRFHPALNLVLRETSDFPVHEIPLNWEDASVRSSVPLFRYAVSLAVMLILYGVLKLFRSRPSRTFVFRKFVWRA